jgi:hypothetical protein
MAYGEFDVLYCPNVRCPAPAPTLCAPRSGLGQFAFFALAEAISFFVICANTRAQGSYGWTAITDIDLCHKKTVRNLMGSHVFQS